MKKLFQILLAGTMLLATNSAQAAEFSHYFGENSNSFHIKISGEIVSGDYERLARYDLKNVPAKPQEYGPPVRPTLFIVLDSPGGNLGTGLAMGLYIREKRLNTVVFNTCASACALMWLAGDPTRYISSNGHIGFHAAYDKDGNTSGTGNAKIGAYMRDLGMSLDAIIYATTASPNGMKWLDEAKAKELGIKATTLRKNQ